MIKKNKSLVIIATLTFVALMMLNVSFEVEDSSPDFANSSILEQYSGNVSYNLIYQFGFQNAMAQSSDPEECDEDCCTGCSDCFGWGGNCEPTELPHYCGAIEPVGGGSIVYCYRQSSW